MDTRHQKDELIVEFFGMLMSERSKTIRIPSLHVNKLSKLRQIQCVFNCQIRYAISCNLISNAHDDIHYLMLFGLLLWSASVTLNINIRKFLKFILCMQCKEVHMICFEEKFMVMIDHPALINYNKTKLTEQWTSWDRQQVIVMVLMMMLKIDLSQAVYSLF